MHLPAFAPTLLSLTLLAHAQDRTQTQNKNFYSAAKEYALGAQLADQVRRHSIPLGLPAVENYAANVGLRLATQMPKMFGFHKNETLPADGGADNLGCSRLSGGSSPRRLQLTAGCNLK